jgi:hypothetical protein
MNIEQLEVATRLIHFMQVMCIFFTGGACGIALHIGIMLACGYFKNKERNNDKYTGI